MPADNGPDPIRRLTPMSPEALLLSLDMLRDSVLETNERMGHLMREVALVRSSLAKVHERLSGLEKVDGEMRKKFDSVPEFVEEMVEKTGRHHVLDLENRIVKDKRDSLAVRLSRTGERQWQVALLVLTIILTAVAGIVFGHNLH